jgi:ubiquinone/menaquinone biosynthesis C-methylase UbiE
MKEYFGDRAKVYKQTFGKRVQLIPALDRALPRVGGKLLDIGCGNGNFGVIAERKGYDYHGIDISEDMICRAKEEFPNGKYKVASANDFSKLYKEHFDVVLMSMLFPSIDNKNDIVHALSEARAVLKPGGLVVLGVAHPAFDAYMQSFLGLRDDVVSNFTSYFESGNTFEVHKTMNGESFVYRDFHWTLSDYFSFIEKADLEVCVLDECQVDDKVVGNKEVDPKKRRIPTYLVLVCSSKS